MNKKVLEKQWVVYLVRCADSTLYCGITNNLERRLEQHNNGTGAKYTRGRGPVELVLSASFANKSIAAQVEYRVKQQPSGRKVAFLKEEKARAVAALLNDA